MANTDGGRTVNVLCLDGGGVRGLSSLIILRKLLCLVNVYIHDGDEDKKNQPRPPLDVFDLVVGTSTGGLIALMIVKLGMDVDECITAYTTLSEDIFSHRHLLGRMTGGFGRVKKFCGKNLRKVLVEVIKERLPETTGDPQDYCMEECDRHKNHHCTLVCRELDPHTKERGDDPVYLCSEKCRMPQCGNGQYKMVKVADAARATSAAPTYFSEVDIIEKLLVDGGYGGTNNPSYAAWSHCFFKTREQYGRIRFVNIGTGSKPGHDRQSSDNRGLMRKYFASSVIRGALGLIKGLKNIATESTTAGEVMDNLAAVKAELLEFNRFSANRGGIHAISMYKYKRNKDIRDLTLQYLQEDTKASEALDNVAKKLAAVYKARQTEGTDLESHLIPHGR